MWATQIEIHGSRRILHPPELYDAAYRLWIRKDDSQTHLMAKMKILTISCVDKDVEQLNCLAVLYRVKHIST